MTDSTTKVSARSLHWLWLLFAGAWLVHLGFSLVGWDNTLLNRLQFRQVQTAITTLFFPVEGFPLAYETPLFGPPWAIPLELPVYQAVVARFSSLTGLALDPSGRLISWLFFQLSLPAFYLMLGSAGLRRPLRWIALSLLVTSPTYLFFSRAFLIESTVLCFSAWFLAAFARWLTTARLTWLLTAMMAGALAATIKLTTMTVFCVAAALFSAGHWLQARSSQPAQARLLAWRILGRSALAAVVPIVAGIAWLVFSTTVRTRNADADILNIIFGFWSFGDLAQRVSAGYWLRTISVWTGGLVGEGGLVLGVFLLARSRVARPWVGGLFAAFLAGQLIFANLYYVHDYYFYGSGVFLIFALGMLLAGQFENETMPAWSCWALPVLLILLQVSTYTRSYLPPQRTNDPVPEYIQVIHDLTRPDDMIVILGQDWDAAIPYYTQRRALMLRNGRERDIPGIAHSLARLDPAKVGAVVIFGGFRNDSTFMHQAMAHLNLGPTPLLLSHPLQIGIWIPLARRAEVMDKLPPHAFVTLDLVPARPPAGESFSLGLRDINHLPEFVSVGQKPIQASSIAGFSNTIVNNQTMLNTHAPSELVFRLPPTAQTMRANFGIHDGAYTSPEGKTDGVEFVVLHRSGDGSEKILFSRLLDPAARSSDQGIQQLELKLGPPLAGEIILRVLPGPRGNTSYDWAYIGAITIK